MTHAMCHKDGDNSQRQDFLTQTQILDCKFATMMARVTPMVASHVLAHPEPPGDLAAADDDDLQTALPASFLVPGTYVPIPYYYRFFFLSGGQPAEQLQVHQVPEGVLVGRVPHRDAVPVVRTDGKNTECRITLEVGLGELALYVGTKYRTGPYRWHICSNYYIVELVQFRPLKPFHHCYELLVETLQDTRRRHCN